MCKKVKIIILMILIIGLTGCDSEFKLGDGAIINDISVEALTTKYQLATEIKAKYSLENSSLIKTDIKNQERDKYTGEFKDEVKVEIGEVKTISTPILGGLLGAEDEQVVEPTIKLSRWGETNFKISPILDGKVSERKMSFNKNKIIFETPKMDFEMYAPDDENYKYVWYLNEKPEKNVVEFDIESKGLDFFYQPALTQEEIDAGDFRPENVVGSYAVYHSTKGGINDINGKEYKTGKAFHIYRPHLIDANGLEAWGNLHIENGIYSVEIPQDFLDKAVYPVKSNDTLGYTTIGGSVGTQNGYSDFVRRTQASADGGTMSKIQAAVYDAGGNSGFKMAVYTDAAGPVPGYLVGNSYPGAVTVTRTTKPTQDSEWTSSTNVSATIIGSAYYWLADMSADTTIYVCYDSVTSGQNKYRSETYAGFPQSSVSGLSDWTWGHSIYATYTPSGGGETTSTSTPSAIFNGNTIINSNIIIN